MKEIYSFSSWCGDAAVPYPFGIGAPSHCYRPGFNLTCDYPSNGKPPRLLLDGDGAFQVVDISLKNTTLRVVSVVATIEADTKNDYGFCFDDYFTDRGEALFSLSTRNELILKGCNVQATLLGSGQGHEHEQAPAIISGCSTFCSDDDGGDTNGGREGGGGGVPDSNPALARPWTVCPEC